MYTYEWICDQGSQIINTTFAKTVIWIGGFFIQKSFLFVREFVVVFFISVLIIICFLFLHQMVRCGCVARWSCLQTTEISASKPSLATFQSETFPPSWSGLKWAEAQAWATAEKPVILRHNSRRWANTQRINTQGKSESQSETHIKPLCKERKQGLSP